MSFLNHLKKPRSVDSLTVDQAMLNYPRRVINSVFAAVPFQPLSEPLKVVAVSQSALSLLTRDDKRNTFQVDKEFVSVLGGANSPTGSCAWSHCYWGTQFGNYAGQLGDGAAFLIGEGETGFEINLKGSGKTPFSRGFDGRKVVRSSIREFLCSEAMAGLGIPTTRAGSIIMSDKSKVLRDINYTGQPIAENCAVVSRIAKTFFRFGSFESDNPQDTPSIRELARYTWNNLLKPLAVKDSDSFMDVVIDRTAFMVAQWQAVGFVHGVMNTDNMSIIGDTIDYGPFGFVETYDPHFVPNTSDKFGKYALSEQPRAAARNCERLYEVLSFHLRDSPGPAVAFSWRDSERIESEFFRKFNQYYDQIMQQKLGVTNERSFTTIRDRFLKLLDYSAVDYTTAFRAISDLRPSTVDAVVARIMATFPSSERVVQLSAKGLRISAADLPEIEEFARTRLHELEKVGIDLNTIARWKHKLERIDRFNDVEATEKVRVESSGLWKVFLADLAPAITDEARERMRAANPVYIPRQSLIQSAIEGVERGQNCDQVDRLLNALLFPFDRKDEFSGLEVPDLSYSGVCLSCSS